MGRMGAPYYGEDLGSVIQDAEKVIAKIKTNKYDFQDLLNLVDVNQAIMRYMIENENKD